MEHAAFDLIVDALSFAAERHSRQRRKDSAASPYINHPIALMRVLAVEARILDPVVLCSALLHDTIEDTETTPEEIVARFGPEIGAVVMELTDDQRLPKADRKRLQIEHASQVSHAARLVKLADKICNLRDVAASPPRNWDLERCQAYFDWASQVVAQIRGTHERLETIFDRTFALRPVG